MLSKQIIVDYLPVSQHTDSLTTCFSPELKTDTNRVTQW